MEEIIASLNQDGEFVFTVDSAFSAFGEYSGSVRNAAWNWPRLLVPTALGDLISPLAGPLQNLATPSAAAEQFVCTGIAALAVAHIQNNVFPGVAGAETIDRSSPAEHTATRINFCDGRSIVLDFHATLDPQNPQRYASVDDFMNNNPIRQNDTSASQCTSILHCGRR